VYWYIADAAFNPDRYYLYFFAALRTLEDGTQYLCGAFLLAF